MSGIRTIRLYDPDPPASDGWHRVRAPGGYEVWHFDAEDAGHDRQIVLSFGQGFGHPQDLRQYAAYLRHPTRVRPPMPQEFAWVSFLLCEQGRTRWEFASHFEAPSFRASRDLLELEIGSSTARWEGGEMRLGLQGLALNPKGGGSRPAVVHLKGELRLRSRVAAPPLPVVFPSRELTSAEHHWVRADGPCDAQGVIEAEGGEKIEFRGGGYYEHTFGTAPPGVGLRGFIKGRVLLGDRACAFALAAPAGRSAADEAILLDARGGRVDPVSVAAVRCDWAARAPGGIRYPERIALDDVLILSEPRLLQASPFHPLQIRVDYRADLAGGGGARALCTVVRPLAVRLRSGAVMPPGAGSCPPCP